jgi:methylase of polypeptide subunit release factors
VNSRIILDQGVGRLVGTDINENAVKDFEQNAAKFGHADNVDVRLVPLDQPEAFPVIGDDEKDDLIISNPPWEDNEPRRMFEYAYLGRGWILLRSMLAGLSDRLKENGKVWLLYGDPSVIPADVPPAVEIIMREAPENNLNATVLYSDPRCSIVEILVDN